MLKTGDVFAGFTIERLLGQGGMGSVYLARHPRLGKLTALKLLNRELFADREVRARFEREADLVAQLDHPNIVAVYDRGSEDAQLWISMQYVDGVDAASVQTATLPPERAVQIIEGVADALDYAHSRGVLHRDVKPANIMLARAVGGHGERVFLTDFGIARLREDSTHLTQAGMFTATLAYASPEQMTGGRLDHATDQYSLGCALYWLLTGIGPFDSPNPGEIISGHLHFMPYPASMRRPGLSPAVDAVIAKAMAKRPADRFHTCAEFAAAARRALEEPAPYPYQPNPQAPQQPFPPAYAPQQQGYPQPPAHPPYPPQSYQPPAAPPPHNPPGYQPPQPGYPSPQPQNYTPTPPPPPAYPPPGTPPAPDQPPQAGPASPGQPPHGAPAPVMRHPQEGVAPPGQPPPGDPAHSGQPHPNLTPTGQPPQADSVPSGTPPPPIPARPDESPQPYPDPSPRGDSAPVVPPPHESAALPGQRSPADQAPSGSPPEGFPAPAAQTPEGGSASAAQMPEGGSASAGRSSWVDSPHSGEPPHGGSASESRSLRVGSAHSGEPAQPPGSSAPSGRPPRAEPVPSDRSQPGVPAYSILPPQAVSGDDDQSAQVARGRSDESRRAADVSAARPPGVAVSGAEKRSGEHSSNPSDAPLDSTRSDRLSREEVAALGGRSPHLDAAVGAEVRPGDAESAGGSGSSAVMRSVTEPVSYAVGVQRDSGGAWVRESGGRRNPGEVDRGVRPRGVAPSRDSDGSGTEAPSGSVSAVDPVGSPSGGGTDMPAVGDESGVPPSVTASGASAAGADSGSESGQRQVTRSGRDVGRAASGAAVAAGGAEQSGAADATAGQVDSSTGQVGVTPAPEDVGLVPTDCQAVDSQTAEPAGSPTAVGPDALPPAAGAPPPFVPYPYPPPQVPPVQPPRRSVFGEVQPAAVVALAVAAGVLLVLVVVLVLSAIDP
ncbi:Serine/threonine-protein kinase pknF [Nocardia otitidiscaviarum]|uniref:non-specific serine/threonine protein kinase n=1 Tax=Nocardia otitidiscaviarum TaxID=1823 RepID=A0A378YRA0_9NOCA|nr:serine/threonine-protein kinase [Nocardia otitidiscaviarum]SUA78929.1 Serine/threonine-protein kinase pknF [Nocardia otitidiscaviarum]